MILSTRNNVKLFQNGNVLPCLPKSARQFKNRSAMLSMILSTRRSAVQCMRKSVLPSLANSVLSSMKRNVEKFRLLFAASNTKLSAQEAEVITAETTSAAEATADIQSGNGRPVQDGTD